MVSRVCHRLVHVELSVTTALLLGKKRDGTLKIRTSGAIGSAHMSDITSRRPQEWPDGRRISRVLAPALHGAKVLFAALSLCGLACGGGSNTTTGQRYPTCSGSDLTACVAAFCNTNGPGCCLASTPPACFNPAASQGQPGWIGYTACGSQPNKACVIGTVPTVPTATLTPTKTGGATPAATPTVTPSPTPGQGKGTQVKITNQTSSQVTVFVKLYAGTPWSFCQTDGSYCRFTIDAGKTQPLPNPDGGNLNFSASFNTKVYACALADGNTIHEANVNTDPNGTYDTTDISLVNGYNASVKTVVTSGGSSTTLGPVSSKTGNQQVLGVYPFGCDVCVARCKPGCSFIPPDNPIPCPTPATCGGGCDHGNSECKMGTQYQPTHPCQYQVPYNSQIEMIVLGVN